MSAKYRKWAQRVLALTSAAGLAALMSGTLPKVQAAPKAASNVESVAAAQMAERLYPSGVTKVVLCSGAPGHYIDTVAGQALAARLHAALLITQSVDVLGQDTINALNALSVPEVSPNPGSVLPYQPPAGKPTVYLLGWHTAISHGIAQTLRALGYPVVRIYGGTAAQTLAAVQNVVAPPLPSGADTLGFPADWPVYAGNQEHNAVFSAPANAPQWEKTGVQWNFPEEAAVPLNAPFPDLANLGQRGAPVKMTQSLGNAVGVTAANGIIYAESDDNHVYAIDAQTGKLLWGTGPLVNALMGDPVISQGLVYVTAGDTGFPFSQVLKYELSGGTHTLVRGLLYSAIYAFNATTGRLVWRQDFHGNAMPTPVVVDGTVYEATGGGNLWAFNAATGTVKWKTYLGGFDSMSSANFWTNPATGQTEILVGTSDQNHVVAVDAATGKILWTQATKLAIFNTGMGDNSPAVDSQNGIVVQDSVVDFNKAQKTTNLAVYAMNAATGDVLWSTKLGVGASPPAYKAGVAMIHNGVIYVGSPVTSTLYALNEKTGQILWQFPFAHAGPAGAGRGAAAYADGVLWVAAGPTVYALDPQTGQELGSYDPGGRFGIVNPVIVGATMYLDNSYDWVQAIPLQKIYPGVKLNP